MPARGLYAFADHNTPSPGSTDPAAPSLLAQWSVHKTFMPVNAGVIGVTIAGLQHQVTTLGGGYRVVIGGAVNAHSAVQTPYHLVTVNGVFHSTRFTVDISSLFSGTDFEYLKLFGYKAGVHQGGAPQLRGGLVVLSGDPVPVRPPLPQTIPAAESLYGVDFDCVRDVDRQMSLAYGLRNLANALLRRLSTPRGSLFYDLDYGLDLREYLHAGLTDAELRGLVGEVPLELEKDERVRSCVVESSYDRRSMELRLRLKVTTEEAENLTLIVAVSQVTVQLLEIAA